MFLSPEERKKLRTASGIGTPSAMNGQNGKWKQEPTTITTPTNQPRSEAHGLGASPFNVAAMGSKRRGNGPAHATLVNNTHPNKRQKTTHPPAHKFGDTLYVKGRGTVSNSSESAPRKPIQFESDVITLDDDDDEDIGVPISNTSNGPGHFEGRSSMAREKPELEMDDDDLMSGVQSVRDGIDTLALEEQFEHYADDSDPIGEFTPSPVQPGFVKESVKKIEERAANQTTPRIDLRDMIGKKTTIKGKMKGKNPQTGALRDAEATMPTKYKGSAKTRGTLSGGQLRVKEWFLGLEHQSGVSGCLLTWDEYRLYVKDKEGRNKPLSLSKDDITNIDYTDTGDPVILALATSSSHKPGYNTEQFTMGDSHRGNVIFKFENTCQDDMYLSLIQWMKKSRQFACQALRGVRACQARWDNACRKSELAEISFGRRSHAENPPRNLKQSASKSGYRLTSPSVEKLSASSRSVSRTIGDDELADPIIPPRRSARSHNTSKSQQLPVQDPDEVILCYPQGVTGAVNITSGDYKRLEPGEFLNDTLIEYGLKRWLRKLEENNQELAAQIHVFSSFFYKKLNKKDHDEGYKSVRKWTAKIDIFSKKYIIVPINENLHWYLAIIYHPEHMLTPNLSPVKSPVTRAKNRSPVLLKSPKKPSSANLSIARHVHTHSAESEPISTASSTPSVSPMQPSSEAEVEALVDSCSVTVEPMDENDKIISTEMDVEPQTTMFPKEHLSDSLFGDHDDISTVHVDPQSFYGKASNVALGKRKAIHEQTLYNQDDSLVILDDDSAPSEFATHIFTFDSLGTRHPQAVRHLKNYLKKEAEDKLGKTETGDVLGKQAHVPVQPNFCDCGLFLLHFAETFISDPHKYFRLITTRTGKATRPTLQDDWKSELTSGMRERLRSDIHQLSLEWKKDRGEKERDVTGIQTIESSDDEIDIVGEVPATSTTPKAGKGKTRKPMRHRG